MIPATRYGRPYSRPEGSAFATGRDWRPLKLVLDDGGLVPDDVALLSSFAEQPELDLWRTAVDSYPRLEIGEPFDPGFRVGGALSIRTATASGGSGFFGV